MTKRIAASNNDLIIEEHPFLAKFLDQLPEDLKKTIFVKKIGKEILRTIPYTPNHSHNSTSLGWKGFYRNRERMILLIRSDGDVISEVVQDDIKSYIKNSLLWLVNIVRSVKVQGEQVKYAIARLEKPNTVKFLLDISVYPGKDAEFTLHKLSSGLDMEGRMNSLLDETKVELLDIGD